MQHTSIWVFGYGSLMNPASVNKSLKRTLASHELAPCLLEGYVRVWDVQEDILSEKLKRPIKGVYLNIQERPGALLNGVLLQLSAAEFEQMTFREKNYLPVSVGENIRPFLPDDPRFPPAGPVFTFIARPECIARPGSPDTYIMQKYIQLIEDGLAHYPGSFRLKYQESTESFGFSLLDGGYTFLDVRQQKALEQKK